MPKLGYKWSEERKAEWRKSKGYEKLCLNAKQPKSKETREKMRDAKAGKCKSADHRRSMSNAHKKRCAIIHKIMADYDIPWKEARSKYMELKDQYQEG